MHEAQRQAKAEQGTLTYAEQRLRDRAEIRFANQPAQGRQRNLGAARLARDRVKRAADEGTSATREGKRPQTTHDGHEQGGMELSRSSWRRA